MTKRRSRRHARETARRLSALLAAGMPAGEALRAGSMCGGPTAPIMRRAATAVDGGRDLSAALQRACPAFTSAELAIVRAGENSAKTAEAVAILAAQLEAEYQDRRRIVAALTYPTILITTMTAVMTLISVVVLPTMADLYRSTGTRLPLATRVLAAAGQAALSYGPAVLTGLAIMLCAGGLTLRLVPSARYRIDLLIVSLPVIGKVVLATHKQRLYALLSSLLASGCDIAESLALAAAAVDNRFIRSRVARVRSLVLRGIPLSEAIRRARLDPAGNEAGLVRLAEAVGNYPAVFSNMSEICGEQRNEAVAKLSAFAEPAAVIVMAAAVGLGAVALYQPILGSAAIVGGF